LSDFNVPTGPQAGALGDPSEFVGPAILKINGTHINGTAAASADIDIRIKHNGAFTIFTGTSDPITGDWAIGVSYSVGDNFIAIMQNTTSDTVAVLSSAATGIMFVRTMEDSVTIDETISATAGNIAFMQPDAAAPGMNINVQFFGTGYDDSTTITTSSSDIVVGPTIVTDKTGDSTTTNGQVLTTIFFINASATPGPVTVFIDSSALFRTFEIVDTTGNFIGTGDYSVAAPGLYTLGNDQGINGNRTIGGTIVLDSLIVPTGITLNINIADIDPSRVGNQGYLPAMIIVDGPVTITGTGTITVVGQPGTGADHCTYGPGGTGGPGGGGGGGGGANAPQTEGCTAPNDFPGFGGDGYAGGGGGSINTEGVDGDGGAGGDGTGAFGDAAPGGSRDGGDGGHGLSDIFKIQNGTGHHHALSYLL